MAREAERPVIALSQLEPRRRIRAPNKRPMLSDRGNQARSKHGRRPACLMIYRDEYYNPETADRGIIRK